MTLALYLAMALLVVGAAIPMLGLAIEWLAQHRAHGIHHASTELPPSF